MRLQTCEQLLSVLLVVRRIVLMMALGTHIFDLSVSGGRLELKEDDVEDWHCRAIRCSRCLVLELVMYCIL